MDPEDDYDFGDLDDMLAQQDDAMDAYDQFGEDGPLGDEATELPNQHQPGPNPAPLQAAGVGNAVASPTAASSQKQQHHPQAHLSQQPPTQRPPQEKTASQAAAAAPPTVAPAATRLLAVAAAIVQRPATTSRGMEIVMRRAAARPKVTEYLNARPPPAGDSESIALPDGNLFFVGVSDGDSAGTPPASANSTVSQPPQSLPLPPPPLKTSLLTVPIKTLMARLDREGVKHPPAAVGEFGAAPRRDSSS